MQKIILGWPRVVKQWSVVLLDVVLAIVATWVAFTLRLDAFQWPSGDQWWLYLLGPLLAVPIFVRFGLYRAIFRYTGQTALHATGRAVLVYGVVLFSILIWQRWSGVPRSVGVLQPLVFLFLVGGSRAIARFWLADMSRTDRMQAGRLLIYGAGAAGAQTASALAVSAQYVLVGFIDDDPAKVRRSINGMPVFSHAQISDVVTRQGVTDILLALPSAARDRRNSIISSLRSLPVHIRTLPGLSDLASGRVTIQDFRELDIDDLLGRETVPPDAALMDKNAAKKVVLVTGAGGSIGSELCRQIVRLRPSKLLLVELNEFALYTAHQELLQIIEHEGLGAVELLPLLASVRDEKRMREIVSTWRPQTVYHAAAYKHVPIVEHNPKEGIKNNVLGTFRLAQVCAECGVADFVLISTDKAVRPTNIMGASKRLAEMVLQAMAADQMKRWTTCFSMVRFGNVLGSSGSVVPLFRHQIKGGGPITLTHQEITRYFMTIPEAAQLVIQAGAMAKSGDVFVLNMGEPIRIIDLARRMVELSGKSIRDENNPEGDIAIQTTGLRPGEKLYEELLIGDNPLPTMHSRIMKAREEFLEFPVLIARLQSFELALAANDVPQIRALLKELVPGYQPNGEVVDWVHLARKS